LRAPPFSLLGSAFLRLPVLPLAQRTRLLVLVLALKLLFRLLLLLRLVLLVLLFVLALTIALTLKTALCCFGVFHGLSPVLTEQTAHLNVCTARLL